VGPASAASAAENGTKLESEEEKFFDLYI